MAEIRDESKGRSDNVRFLLGALSVAVYADVAASVFLRGYSAKVLGMPMAATSVGMGLLALVVLLAAYWIWSAGKAGIGESIEGLLPWGPFAALAGVMMLFTTAQAGAIKAPMGAYVWAGALAVVAFVVAWMATGGKPRAARAVVFVIYLATMSAVAGSLSTTPLWERPAAAIMTAETATQPGAAAGTEAPGGPAPVPVVKPPTTTVGADRIGVLAGKGSGMSVEKVVIRGDWRDAAVILPEGFLSTKVRLPEGAKVTFSAAARGDLGESKAVVTLVHGGGQQVLWEKKGGEISRGPWEDVSVPLTVSGEGELVFEVTSSKSDGAVFFANPRLRVARGKRPNVILLVNDTMRADHLGLYGYNKATSAEIDDAAKTGVVFEDCIVQAPWTIPSMGTIFTSLYPTTHGMVAADKGLSPLLDTLGEAFNAAGFFTGCIQTNPNLSPEAGVAQGFNEYRMIPMKRPTEEDKSFYMRAQGVNELVEEWIHAHRDTTFFLYVHYMDTHMPYTPLAEFDTFGPDPESKYNGALAYFSHQFGRLFDRLRADGVLDDTIVVLTSDHGEQFWEHGTARHGNCLHAEELNVPLVFWLPGAGEGLRVGPRVGAIDIAPTLVAIAGAKPFAEAQGVSLAGALSGVSFQRTPLFGELLTYKPVGEFLVSLTAGQYRFIIDNPGSDWMTRFELYDMEKDKGEYVNIARENQGTVAAMKGEVEAYLAAQRALHKKLVPEEFAFPISEDRQRMLRAIGYLSPGADGEGSGK